MNLWNKRLRPKTDLYIDFGGAVPKLLLTVADSVEVIRVIPYHVLRDCVTFDPISLPQDREPLE